MKAEIEEGELPDLKAIKRHNAVEIKSPLTFWIGILVLGMFLEILSVFLKLSILDGLAKLIIQTPGDIILPLIAGLWIGELVSKYADNISSAAKRAAINATYAILVYLVSIFIVYIVFQYANSSLLKIPLNEFLVSQVGIPFVIVMVMVPLFAILSTARKIS